MKLSTLDWLKKVKMETPSIKVRQCLILKNDVYLSVQGSDYHDCVPRENLTCLTQYEKLEIKFVKGFNSYKFDKLLEDMNWLPYEGFTKIGPYKNSTEFNKKTEHNDDKYFELIGEMDVQYGCRILPLVPLDVVVKIIDHLGGVIGLNDKFIEKE